MGSHCNISSNPWDTLKPCQNNGTCSNVRTNINGYTCKCLSGLNGAQCQYDHRPCKPTTCWNNDIERTCNETSNTTFQCLYQPGWTSDRCELMIDYCENITRQNEVVCRRLFMNYTCECLDESFSDRHCEIVATKLATLNYIANSFGYVAISAIIGVVAFIVIIDVLKYCFGIDITKHDLECIRRAKAIKRVKQRRRPVIQRFIYLNEPSLNNKQKIE